MILYYIYMIYNINDIKKWKNCKRVKNGEYFIARNFTRIVITGERHIKFVAYLRKCVKNKTNIYL